jgi:hypothetical protein
LGGADPVDARIERGAAQFGGKGGARGPAGGVVEGETEVDLGLYGDRVTQVGLADDGGGPEARRGDSGMSPEVLAQVARAGVGGLGPGQHGEVTGGPQADRRFHGLGRGRGEDQQDDCHTHGREDLEHGPHRPPTRADSCM